MKSLADLYGRMQAAYDKAASALGHSCAGCPQNCCLSHFEHHTYIEWAYLWAGMDRLSPEARQAILTQASDNAHQARFLLAQGMRPRLACPLLGADGRCSLYAHRLMICRLFGVPHTMAKPGQQPTAYPGCFRCPELAPDHPPLDRTPFYLELARLEMSYLGNKTRTLPKVGMTLSEMLASGPPPV